MVNIDGTEYLTSPEAADWLGMHPGSLKNQRVFKRSGMPYRVLFGRVFYAKADVIAYEERRQLGIA